MQETDASPDGIAIIGMAARLPGAADVDGFWRNLLVGRSALRRFDRDALREAGFSEAALADPNLVPVFGALDGVDAFDEGFFGFPPARAAALDPQQRLLLQTAWHALEHAGYGPGTTDATIGTYLSITQSSYGGQDAAADLADSFFLLTSRDKDYAASRVAYKLDLTGPSMMIQSASSGSLAAVHAAIEGLLSGQCDMAIAGGASIALPQGGYRVAPGLMLSPSGTCRAFDAAADGTVPGNGLGIVVLKPLAQAMADRDTIHAVIRGSALTNDGAHKSDYLAPSVRGQARAVGEALAVAGIDPATIGYIETHGTGTLIGDPIEMRALSQVFARSAGRAQPCVLGALKPSIGHLHVASGVAGLIKAALVVHHGVIPPSLGFADANPELALADTPFAMATERADWICDGPRRAGVSAFGLGGTNVHVVLEQAPPPPPARSAAGPVALVLSARTERDLAQTGAALVAYLRAHPDAPLADIGWTLATGRQRFAHRRAVLCRDAAEAIAALQNGAPAGEGGGAMGEAARTWLAGGAPDWCAAFAGLDARRVPLPGYPFAANRHWIAPVPPVSVPSVARQQRLPENRLVWLQDLFGTTLKMPPASLDPDAPYEAFGIDSLLVNTLTLALQKHFPALRTTALFEHTTLRKLADHLAALEPRPAPSMPPHPATEAIAIIGMAGRYPGAPDVDAFWNNLRAGHDSITEVPGERWNWRDQFDPARKDRSYTRWGGFIADADKFDPLFFGISPREAKLLDPQQRLFLETAWSALEDAGTTRAALKAAAQARGGDVGVFVGAMHTAYRLLGADAVAAGQLVQANHWSIANRVSYVFDFTGPSLTVDTACSASLAAVHLACESLRRGECRAALAGGVSLVLHPQQPLELCRAGMLSHGPHNSAFGAEGDGFVQGEGVGVVVLKPLAAALEDGDRVLAVICGSAMNAGGRTAGYTVPNPRAQAAVVSAALHRARVAADSIGAVECHGTGTGLGDPIEIAGLCDAFQGAGAQGCAIGSVKSNIGHLEAAAGIAGLTKAVLQLQHATLVPSLHALPPNPRIDFAATPFRVQTTAAPWPAPTGGVRRAGVSSFGAGGTNVHVVLEEAPSVPLHTPQSGPFVVPLSARTPERLGVLAARLKLWLEAVPAELADIAFTLALGREAMEARVALVVQDRDELLQRLSRLPDPQPAGAIPDAGAVDAALERRDVAALARFWEAGATVDWTRVFDGVAGRRIALPAYPFLRERHWLPEMDVPTPAAAAQGLLGPALPTLAAEARWQIRLDGKAPVLADHRVQGTPILPGVATIELAWQAARQLGHGPVLSIQDVTWLRPVAADGDALFVLRDTPNGLSFAVEREGVPCVTGRIAAAPPPAAIDASPWQEPGEPGETLYARLAARALAYGPAFRTVSRFRAEGHNATGLARASGLLAGYAIDPGLLDAALQLTAALVADAAGPVLPFSVQRIDVHRLPPDTVRLVARRLDDGAEPGIARFDVTIASESGEACIVLADVAGRVMHAPPPALPCYVPEWVAQAAVPKGIPAGPHLVLAERAHHWRAALQHVLPDATARDPADSGTMAGPVGHVVLAFEPSEAGLDRLFQQLQELGRSVGLEKLTISVLAPPEPWGAAMLALARVAAREFPAWTLRPILLETPDDLAAALADPGDEVGREVRWRRGERHVRVLRPEIVQAASPPFRPGGVYLILGGAGGIGMALATHLVARHGARVVLIGRHAPALPLAEGIRFFAADACDAAALRRAVAEVRARFGRIDGAIHSAIVMEDRALAQMTHETFHAALDVKTRGTLNLVDALSGETLDWLAFFSSANSFAANAGQANYVAGCAFKDAYAERAAARLGCPVKVINWGFWGEVGRVADAAYRARLERRGVHPIGTEEGIAAIERVLGAAHPQVLVLKADAAVLAGLGVVARDETSKDETPETAALAEHDRLDALTREAVACWAAATTLRAENVAPRHRKVHAALVEMAARGPRPAPERAAVEQAQQIFAAAHPDLAPHVALLRRCLDHLDAVLRDGMPATEVLFPGSSMALVEGIYRGDRLTAACNARVAAAVREAAVVRRGKVVRVLEVGAGTGGTSASVLDALAGCGVEVEYHYTDVSRAFALHGERRFGGRFPFVRFGVLDLAHDPASQGYEPAHFDIVLGANVVHVTPDLRRTTHWLRSLLVPGGLLVLYEMTALPDFATATFGLLDGWWAFTDRRLPHGPLLDAPGWARVLADAGYEAVTLGGLGGPEPEALRHSIISAEAPAGAAEPARTEEPASSLIAAIRDVVAETLQMAPDQLRTDRNFSDYGADSIISVDLIAALNARFDVTLKPTILFSHPTIERLAAHLTARHRPRLPVASASPAPQRAAPVAVSVPRGAAGAWADDIAIVGLAGRFPGADTIARFWDVIRDGVCTVGPVPSDRWDHASLFDPEPGLAGRTQCPAGGFLTDIESFDPLFFSLSPAEATLMDPQQRLFLETAWHALENAGYAGRHPAHARCGVFVGTVAGDYDELLRQCGRGTDAQRFMGNAASMLAARIAYRLDLHGPCLSVDTACSSSLLAVQLACESLQRGESDLALAGGVAVLTTPGFYLAASNAGMLSPTGRCHTLDEAADGFVPGEAVAAVVLKRRRDAERDGDTVLAVIKGAATNQDGASNGITAPSGAAQTALESEVYRRFALDPATITYVELHGTGTRLGDPIEMEALRSAFGPASRGCAVGSVKANIGHSLPAAGIAGLVKLVLCLQNHTIPPLAGFRRLNAHIERDDVLSVPTEARDWRAAGPRRAAISSFGFSGTNVHLVVEEALPVTVPAATRRPARRPWELAVFSAMDAAALVRLQAEMAAWIAQDDGRTPLPDLCGTLARGRVHLPHRAAFVVGSAAELAAALAGAPSRDASPEAAAACRSYLAGEMPDWDRLYPEGSFARVALPTYPFERRRCWPMRPAATAPDRPAAEDGPLSIFDAVIRDLRVGT